jgi:hypothetical protein
MKGPYGRLKFVIRRLWQCPNCQRRAWTTGQVVTRACSCSAPGDGPPVWMTLVEESRALRKPEDASSDLEG